MVEHQHIGPPALLDTPHFRSQFLERDARPVRVEEAYEKSKAEVNEQVKHAGEEAVYELGITNFPPKLIHLVGRLMFRTSYGQNVLRHSVEMAKIGALIAEEIGADIQIVKQH
jgi:ribonuclease Y